MNNQAIILNKALNGDAKAFEAIHEITYKQVYYVVRQILNNKEDIEDAIQETYIKVFKKLSQLSDAAKLQSWVNSIAINCAKDIVKKKKPLLFSNILQEDEKPEEKFNIQDEDRLSNPQEHLDLNATQQIVQAIIDSLPEDQRICLTMFHFENKKISEIAEELDVSESTVKSRLRYGKTKIKDEILRLEQENSIALHGMSPFAFFLYVFRNGFSASSIANAATGAAVVTTATTAAVTVGTTTAITGHILIKAVSVMLAVSIAAGSATLAAKKLLVKPTTPDMNITTTAYQENDSTQTKNKKTAKAKITPLSKQTMTYKYHWENCNFSAGVTDIYALPDVIKYYNYQEYFRIAGLKNGSFALLKDNGEIIQSVDTVEGAISYFSNYDFDKNDLNNIRLINGHNNYYYNPKTKMMVGDISPLGEDMYIIDDACLQYNANIWTLLYHVARAHNKFTSNEIVDYSLCIHSKAELMKYLNTYFDKKMTKASFEEMRYLAVKKSSYDTDIKEKNGYSFAYTKDTNNQKYALFDLEKWKPVTKYEYDNIWFDDKASFISYYGRSKAIALVKDKQTFFLNTQTGKLINREKYDCNCIDTSISKNNCNENFLYAFNKTGYAPVCRNGKWGVIDLNGFTVIEFGFEKIVPSREDTVFWAKFDGKWGKISIP